MPFLIDGYNLLFSLGLAGKRTEPKAFELARDRLLDWLHTAHGPEASSVTVVFDGRRSPIPRLTEYDDRGLHIRFAVGMSADDLIEEMIRRDANPRKLTVVSSDHRIQAAARRRDCVAWDISRYLDWAMAKGKPLPAPPEAPGKPDASPAEVERWLREFGNIDTDPELRRFNRPFEDFEDGAP